MGNQTQEQRALLTDFAHTTMYSEALRTLYANIRFQWENSAERPACAHSLLIPTPSAYGDYAAVAANLAIVAAQSGSAAILVDADLRTPSYQQRFGLEKTTGLSDLLLDESLTPEKIAAALQSTFIPGLRLLGAGTTSAQASSASTVPASTVSASSLSASPLSVEPRVPPSAATGAATLAARPVAGWRSIRRIRRWTWRRAGRTTCCATCWGSIAGRR